MLITRRDFALRVMAQIPLLKKASVHDTGIWAPGAKDRDLLVPALGDRVAHNKRKHGAKCAAEAGEHGHDAEHGHACGAGTDQVAAGAAPAAADGTAAASPATLTKAVANDGTDSPVATVADNDQAGSAGTPAANPTPIDEAAAKAASAKLSWAECLQRAWGFDVLQCPCGGRRKLIAVIRNPTQVEKILRHVGQWREAGDREDDDVIAIRGPPGTFDDEVDEAPDEKFDGVDDPVELDWAA